MSLANTYPVLRTRPSLRTRILQNQRGVVTIPAGQSGITKPSTQSFSERYRGTEYGTQPQRAMVSQPHVSRGRSLWLVAGSAAAVVIGVALAAIPT